MDVMSTTSEQTKWSSLDGRREGRAWVIRASGEFDVSTSPAVKDAFARVPASCDRIVIDLSGVTFLDCSALSALETAIEGCRGDVYLRSPSEPVRRLARLAGLNESEWSGAMAKDVRFA